MLPQYFIVKMDYWWKMEISNKLNTNISAMMATSDNYGQLI